MSLTTVTGKVSGVRVDSSVTVNTSVTVNQNGYSNPSSSSSQTVKKDTTYFRVDNKPAYMSVAINITNDDSVTVAGVQQGEFEAIAVNNHTTKTMYWMPEPSTVPEIIYIVIGVFTRGIYGIGWLLIGGGILFLVNKKKRIKLIKDARALVQNAPLPAKG
ncbi:MAG: hypothetical protein JNN05_08635 [Candidatus Omnitrophica bacterium]|nr:hypothetical protein [Candidatus Omnitrophota bacterium]